MKGPHDGKPMTYHFAAPKRGHDKSWRTEADSLDKAIRRFRMGALHPHQYVNRDLQITRKIVTREGYDRNLAVGSNPGAKVGVYDSSWDLIAEIPPEGDEAAQFARHLLPQGVQASMESASSSTALAVSDLPSSLQQIDTASRREIEDRLIQVKAMQGELERQKHALQQQVNAMMAEVEKRLEQIWMVELYIGTHEEVHQLASGTTAPADTPITVRQQVLCMDEEMAVYDWTYNPDGIGEFDFEHIERFDKWLTEDPAHLTAILPEPKGMAGLRVRRKADKKYFTDGGFAAAWANAELNAYNAKTYFLIRNGDNLYRIWADVDLWPNLFPTRAEFDPVKEYKWESDREKDQKRMKKYFAGTLAVQGIIDRSTLFHPLPPVEGLSLFNPVHNKWFQMVRDAEALLPAETGLLTWKTYKEWLKSKIIAGARVLYTGNTRDMEYDKLHERTGIRSVGAWPCHGEVYVIDREEKSRWSSKEYSFLYNPGDTIWPKDYWQDTHERTRRVRFYCHSDEVVPVDAMSWRVLFHLLSDRNEREHYADSFVTLFHWAKMKREEEVREKPFADLVLRQVGADPNDEDAQVRVFRLIRWWKMKTKLNRSLGDDEPKALRMITKAFKAGQDFEDDPEIELLKRGA